MPFAYISLSAGLRAIDLHTLVNASRSLGGGWWTTMRKVLLPNMRVAVLSATVLTVALVLGEYTMASLDQYQTFSVWIVAFEQEQLPRVGGGVAAVFVRHMASAHGYFVLRAGPPRRWRWCMTAVGRLKWVAGAGSAFPAGPSAPAGLGAPASFAGPSAPAGIAGP